MTLLYVYHDSDTRVPWLIRACAGTFASVCTSFSTIQWYLLEPLSPRTLVCLCAMTLSYVCQDSCMRVPWLLGVCAPQSELYNDIYFRHSLPWLLCMCTMTLSYVRQDSCVHVPWLLGVCAPQMWSQVSRVSLLCGFKCLLRVSFVCTSF